MICIQGFVVLVGLALGATYWFESSETGHVIAEQNRADTVPWRGTSGELDAAFPGWRRGCVGCAAWLFVIAAAVAVYLALV